MKIIIASSNEGKIKELREIVGNKYQLLSKDEIGYFKDVVEDGKTLAENAVKKAKDIYEKTGIATISDDTGLFVPALHNSPGIYSARYAGEGASDEENMDKLLLEMKYLEGEEREAYFKTMICYICNDGRVEFIEGKLRGHIAKEKIGNKGFGYDPIFIPLGYDKTLAELDSNVKNQISHRRMAYDGLKNFLEESVD